MSLDLSRRREERRRAFCDWPAGWIVAGKASAIYSAYRRIALVNQKFPRSCDDGLKRRTWRGSSATGKGEQTRIQDQQEEFAARARREDRQRNLRGRRLRVAFRNFDA